MMRSPLAARRTSGVRAGLPQEVRQPSASVSRSAAWSTVSWSLFLGHTRWKSRLRLAIVLSSRTCRSSSAFRRIATVGFPPEGMGFLAGVLRAHVGILGADGLFLVGLPGDQRRVELLVGH